MAAPLTLSPRCGFCNSQDHLLRCAGCKVMQYCSKEHQISHREAHKRLCTRAKKARAHLDEEEQKLLDERGNDFDMPAYPFQNEVGHFWGIWGTRDYMRARYGFVEAILKINTFDAVQASNDHLRDLLRLCRGDNMGVRYHIPSLLLRLHRDQDCYDFLKWWFTTGQEGDYDWGDTSLPYLDVVNADVFEPVDLFCDKYSSLSHTTAITLLKIRLLLDLQDLQNITSISSKIPQELVDHTKKLPPSNKRHCKEQGNHAFHRSERTYQKVGGPNRQTIRGSQRGQQAFLACTVEARASSRRRVISV